MPDRESETGAEERPSKSQRKRDMQQLRDLGEHLLAAPEERLLKLSDANLVEAVLACKKITKGNARKRQLQYIGKLLRTADVDAVRELVDSMNAGKKAYAAKFHRLEQWREQLMAENSRAMEDVLAEFPDIDRQHINQLVRQSKRELEAGKPPAAARKLYKYLHEISEQQVLASALDETRDG